MINVDLSDSSRLYTSSKHFCCMLFPENYCLPAKDCAHYYNYGEVEAGSCPSCRTKLSACEGVTCKPIRECIRYSAQVLEGECCFSCERYRDFIDRDPSE